MCGNPFDDYINANYIPVSKYTVQKGIFSKVTWLLDMLYIRFSLIIFIDLFLVRATIQEKSL